jgi:hypothetical protein
MVMLRILSSRLLSQQTQNETDECITVVVVIIVVMMMVVDVRELRLEW